ncbi:aminotransferase class I/II-fold pyridoxal phosphate-dependent enzyme [Pontibacter sp. MBLB2868]|uniref:aminotransferase class I/II-fold pyridoxal phosphate-dependent enzyme n=1 Tax=Pontibacter sp. MBLB2868 TaxID=3451555 RepID=UPI003F753A7F
MKTTSTATYSAAANENLFGISEKVTQAIQEALQFINSYPNPHAAPLRLAISQQLSISQDEVVIGSGSAELISLLIRAICKSNQPNAILSTEPTYPLYKHEAEALGVKYNTAPLNSGYEFDIEALLRQVDASTRLLFISNPNNPTGTYLTQAQIEQLVKETPAHVVLALDEAYVEFADAPDYGSGLPYLYQRENLVLLRTFSKAYGLASMRVGYMVAQQPLLGRIMQVKQPYNVNHLAQVSALAALDDTAHLTYTLDQTAAGKLHLQDILDKLGVQWWPSQGNFLYTDAGIPVLPVAEQLQEQGIQIRSNSDSNFGARITVGPKVHQQHLYEQLKNILAPENIWADNVLAEILRTGYQIAAAEQEAPTPAVAALAQLANGDGNAAERIALAYLRAFSAHLSEHGHAHTGNLYNSTYGVTDMISAFNVLMKSTPLVTFGHHLANLAIADSVAGTTEVHILDLGIGSGLQWLHLMELLASRANGTVSLKITGVDIPAVGDDPAIRLRMTGEMLQEAAGKSGISFTYTGIAQKLEEINLLDLTYSASETLVINSAFTLHHLPDQLTTEIDYRDRILRQIKALNPALLTLTEPDSEHNRLNFLPRLRESLRHYYTVFDVLDTLLPPLLPERQVIEQEFFGREIINVISCEGINRVERHERNEAWQQRMIRNGFTPAVSKISPENLAQALDLHENFTLKENGAGYTLCWKNTPVVAATLWT